MEVGVNQVLIPTTTRQNKYVTQICKRTSLITSLTNCFADSICSLEPSICKVLSVDVSPGGKCNGITYRKEE